MSKFKLAPSPTPKIDDPITREQFVAGASLIHSQSARRPIKPVRVNFDLDPETHKRLKLRAIESGTTVAALVRDLIVSELG